ncbi:MAG: RIP metalloprotease RseP [Candidatus Paceibacterota bacterium]|jgi:regulator of sigma E protease
MSIFLLIVILLVLVVAHEFGHFIVAKKSGMRVDEFGFGFPPKLFSIKKGETKYSFNLIPFGGFVKIFGENPDEKDAIDPDSSRAFNNRPKIAQALVLSAGIVANLLVAWILFSIGFASGMPASTDAIPKGAIVTNTSLVILDVEKNSPAQVAGLQSGDGITKLSSSNDEITTPTPTSLKNFIVSHSDKNIDVIYTRHGTENITSVTPVIKKGQPMIGIAMDTIATVRLPIHKAIIAGAVETAVLSDKIVVGLGKLIGDAFTGNGSLDDVAGPVGLVGSVGGAYSFGIIYLLSFAAMISVNLAVINLMPFPALDGGRLLFLLIEKIKGSPIKPKTANIVNMIGFLILISLMLLITTHDIFKLF